MFTSLLWCCTMGMYVDLDIREWQLQLHGSAKCHGTPPPQSLLFSKHFLGKGYFIYLGRLKHHDEGQHPCRHQRAAPRTGRYTNGNPRSHLSTSPQSAALCILTFTPLPGLNVKESAFLIFPVISNASIKSYLCKILTTRKLASVKAYCSIA
jgi:hypothetical protein